MGDPLVNLRDAIRRRLTKQTPQRHRTIDPHYVATLLSTNEVDALDALARHLMSEAATTPISRRDLRVLMDGLPVSRETLDALVDAGLADRDSTLYRITTAGLDVLKAVAEMDEIAERTDR